jgi:hypothetical protein
MWLTTLSVRPRSVYGLVVATFVIESYLSRARAGDFDRSVAELRHAVEVAAAGGDRSIRHVRSYYVADDEIAYDVVEASSSETVEQLARDAGLTPDRIVEAAVG